MNTFQTHVSFRNTDALSLYESLAELTWGRLRDSRRLGLGFSENTVSDLAMVKIARTVPNEVGVFGVSKLDERLVNFDWLWVVSRSDIAPRFYVSTLFSYHFVLDLLPL